MSITTTLYAYNNCKSPRYQTGIYGGVTWSVARGSGGTSVLDGITRGYVVELETAITPSDTWSQLCRCAIQFDATSIPAGARILSAKLRLFIEYVQDLLNLAPTAVICGFQTDWSGQTLPIPEMYADVANIALSPANGSFTPNAWVEFNLNKQGIAKIRKGAGAGKTWFTCRNNYDLSGTEPLQPGGYYWTTVGFFNDSGRAGYGPQLVVTYTMAPLVAGDIHIDQLKYRHAERMAF